MAKRLKAITDLTPDTRNANRGTIRGLAMLEDSLRAYGAGRSILVDRDGNVIAGNKTLEAANDLGLKVKVVETDGTELVIVQRTDLDINSKQGRELAIADNRVGQVSLDWDADTLTALQADSEIDLAKFFDGDEVDAILKEPFTPNTMPSIGAAHYTNSDIEKTKDRLDNKFKDNKDYIEVTCPHCAKDFYIDKQAAG